MTQNTFNPVCLFIICHSVWIIFHFSLNKLCQQCLTHYKPFYKCLQITHEYIRTTSCIN